MRWPISTPERCAGVSRLIKNLAHPHRLMILCLLSETPRTVTELTEAINASQSGVSQFLTRMKMEGLIAGDRQGRTVTYRIVSPELRQLLASLGEILCSASGDRSQ